MRRLHEPGELNRRHTAKSTPLQGAKERLQELLGDYEPQLTLGYGACSGCGALLFVTPRAPHALAGEVSRLLALCNISGQVLRTATPTACDVCGQRIEPPVMEIFERDGEGLEVFFDA